MAAPPPARLLQDMWGEEGVYRDLFAPILSFIETSLSAALQVRDCTAVVSRGAVLVATYSMSLIFTEVPLSATLAMRFEPHQLLLPRCSAAI